SRSSTRATEWSGAAGRSVRQFAEPIRTEGSGQAHSYIRSPLSSRTTIRFWSLMIVPEFSESRATRSDDDRDLLIASGLLDDAGYRRHAGLSDSVDVAAHYLEFGWLQGLEPRDGFDGQFLLPYYKSAGLPGPPALTWLELSVMPGRRAPTNHLEAEIFATRIRSSPLFDATTYARRLPADLDPAIHYVVV